MLSKKASHQASRGESRRVPSGAPHKNQKTRSFLTFVSKNLAGSDMAKAQNYSVGIAEQQADLHCTFDTTATGMTCENTGMLVRPNPLSTKNFQQ